MVRAAEPTKKRGRLSRGDGLKSMIHLVTPHKGVTGTVGSSEAELLIWIKEQQRDC
jgi:hypothetical protein